MRETHLEEEIASWASTKIESAVFTPQEGFYSFEVITEAYEKGKKDGKERLKNLLMEDLKNKIEKHANVLKKSLQDSVEHLNKKDYKPTKIFVFLSSHESKIIYAIKESIYTTDDFLDYAYDMSADIKLEAYNNGSLMSLGFISDNENINFDALKADGFDMAMDLITGKHIY